VAGEFARAVRRCLHDQIGQLGSGLQRARQRMLGRCGGTISPRRSGRSNRPAHFRAEN
jgi:hypothetical protein